MVLEKLAMQLPGWEIVLFIILVLIFFIVGAIVTIVIMSRLRWPLNYVVLEDVAGKGFSITRKGKCRIIGFGDGGEEIILLKHLNKYRVGYGKRIGAKQIGWAVGSDGLWYQFTFGDLNKILREIGIAPVSVNVRLGMSSVRKGLDNRYQDKSWSEKYLPLILGGMVIISLLIFAGMFYYSTKKQIEIANINSGSINATRATQEATQKTLATLDQILSRINFNAQNSSEFIGGSGLVPNG